MNGSSGVGPVEQVLLDVTLVALCDRNGLGGKARARFEFIDTWFVTGLAFLAQAVCSTGSVFVISFRKGDSQTSTRSFAQESVSNPFPFSGQTHQMNMQPLSTLQRGMSEKQTEHSSE